MNLVQWKALYSRHHHWEFWRTLPLFFTDPGIISCYSCLQEISPAHGFGFSDTWPEPIQQVRCTRLLDHGASLPMMTIVDADTRSTTKVSTFQQIGELHIFPPNLSCQRVQKIIVTSSATTARDCSRSSENLSVKKWHTYNFATDSKNDSHLANMKNIVRIFRFANTTRSFW